MRPRIIGKYLGQLAVVLAAVNLVPLGASVYFGDAAVHMLAAVSTGGFSTHDASVAALGGGPAQGAAAAASLLGAVALPVYYRAYQGNWRAVARDEELHPLLAATLGVCVLLLFRLLGLMLKRLAMPSHAVAELRLGGGASEPRKSRAACCCLPLPADGAAVVDSVSHARP